MDKKAQFIEEIGNAYTFKGESIILGAPMYKQEVLTDTFVRIPLKTLNRHGLIAGATGTGKTKTLQIIIEQLSAKGIPSLVMDIKGDLSGVAVAGDYNPKVEDRNNAIGIPFSASGSPVEFLSLSNDVGAEYGAVSLATIGTILRKVIELEQQGGDKFFGERSFDVEDLVRFDEHGHGYISILRVTDIQDKPKLFSTFMLQLLAEIYSTFPEEGDLDQPKLVIFIDEAHLIFNQASKALLNQIETIVKLIRSKGVGIFFVTQNPQDVPNSVLGQLGLKVQHALRAFTAKDRKDIKLTAENYPLSNHYSVDTLLTELGIGEAIIAALNEKGIPTPLVHCYLRSPQSRMDVLTQSEMDKIMRSSRIKPKYDEIINRESAYEMLNQKLESSSISEKKQPAPTKGRPKQEKSTFEKVMDSPLTKQVGRTFTTSLIRGIMGIITNKQSKKNSSWF